MSTVNSARRDEHGNPTTGTAEGVDAYDRAIDRLLRFHPDVVDQAVALVEEHPDLAMGQALMAYLNLMSTDAPDLAAARDAHAAMLPVPGNDREAMHALAVGRWLDGDWIGASRALDELLARWPSDLLALAIGHQLDFFLGDARNLRDRPGRSLPELDPDHPHVAFVRGMQAFGLEESGHYDLSERTGLDAVAVNPDDVWAIHAVVHTYEMQGRVDDGLRFLLTRTDDWGSGNLFTVHNWWHLGLYHLEAGDPGAALAIYDSQIHHAGSAGVPIEMLDASALLWRLHLDGHAVGDRWGVLAEAWASRLEDEPWYAFNDLHGVMAMVGAGRNPDAVAAIARLEAYTRERGRGTNVMMTSEVGLPACRAVVAWSEGRHEDVVRELAPIRLTLNRFGGSHAQRDALQRTLVDSALQSGETSLARALVAERLSLRESSVYGWTQRARWLQAMDDQTSADRALATAGAHQARFAAAAATVTPAVSGTA
jgi:hypothetical protein